MDTDEHGSSLPAGQVTHEVIGASFEVLNELGHGLNEKPYENALVHEIGLRNLAVSQQQTFDIIYKNTCVGVFIPDLIIESLVVVDPKTVEAITAIERGQMLNYLRITGLKVGSVINFKHPKLEWERIVL